MTDTPTTRDRYRGALLGLAAGDALWAFHKARDFREGALLAANLGDDADTTAAIYGQLAGAYYGVEGIPSAWRARLAMAPDITAMADALYESAGLPEPGDAPRP